MSNREVKYLSAEELFIQPWEREGLIAFLENCRLKTYREEDEFNMNHGCFLKSELYHNVNLCGTVYCIGGFVALHHGMNQKEANRYVMLSCSPALKVLYFPYFNSKWTDITRDHAVQAVENFLKSGDPKWYDL